MPASGIKKDKINRVNYKNPSKAQSVKTLHKASKNKKEESVFKMVKLDEKTVKVAERAVNLKVGYEVLFKLAEERGYVVKAAAGHKFTKFEVMYTNNLKFQRSVDGLLQLLKVEIEEYYTEQNIASIREELRAAKGEINRITSEERFEKARKLAIKTEKTVEEIAEIEKLEEELEIELIILDEAKKDSKRLAKKAHDSIKAQALAEYKKRMGRV